ncbi:MAG: AIR synthase-related protein [Candidatus Jordarchaeaceae archaeon]
MADLEGLVRRLYAKNFSKEEIISRLVDEIKIYKDLTDEEAYEMANAVFSETWTTINQKTTKEVEDILQYSNCGATMHDLGVGCRGEGDFFVHRLLAKISDAGISTLLGPQSQDDAGAVKGEHDIIVVSVDGTHSRLTEFPFIAGFHVTRASLRDVYIKGAKPVALLTDLHLADDGDVGRLFDFMAGIRTVSKLTGIPLVAGSTLRIGGDMVIGTRFVSCVGVVGVVKEPHLIAARARVKPGDDIIMTEGAGGGTIATTAIYGGIPEVIMETLNIQFIKACETLMNRNLFGKIHAATDWTNGGLRGDCNEICKTAGVGIKIFEEKVESLVNPIVLKMLRNLNIDYLGVSIDSLLIFNPPQFSEEILSVLRDAKVKCDIIGTVVETPKRAELISKGEIKSLQPHYREAAYTKIKKLIGEESPENKEKIMDKTIHAAKEAIEKSERIIKMIQSRTT